MLRLIPRRVFALVLLLAVHGLVGCGKQTPEISKKVYTVPAAIVRQDEEEVRVRKLRSEREKLLAQHSTPAASDKQQMLAVLVPQPAASLFWTLKLQGKPEALTPVRAELQKFVESFHWQATDGSLPDWQLPVGWAKSDASDNFGRVATIVIASQEGPLNLAIAKFGLSGEWQDTVLANVNRWRGQLKLEPLEAAGIDTNLTKIKFEGGEALLLDEQGIASSRPGMGMMPPNASATNTPPATESKEPPSPSKESASTVPATDARKPLDYNVPDNWQAKQGSSLRVASFTVTQGNESAEVAVTQFPKVAQMAEPLANVNRWRGELGLTPATAEDLSAQTSKLTIDGEPATLFFASGTMRDKPASTLAAMVIRNERVWFFKMQGDLTLVQQQRPQFESFLQSVKFQ